MPVDISREVALERLCSLFDNQELPVGIREQAKRLHRRLEAGVRILVLGPRPVGKSALCDILLNQDDAGCCHGASRVFCAGDAHTDEFLQATGFESPVSHKVSVNLLGRIVLWDLHSEADPEMLVSDYRRVFEEADIVIWCTQTFSEQEAGIWRNASEGLKDHSFLVLTKVDTFPHEAMLARRLKDLRDTAEDEFHSIIPTSTNLLEPAIAAGQSVSDQVLAASGIKALKDALIGLIESGCRADLDHAALLLERHSHSENASHDTVSRDQDLTQSIETIGAIRATLTSRAFDLAELTFDESNGDMTEVLQFCGAITEELVDCVSVNGAKKILAPKWCAAFEVASDKVILTAMENDTRSAADATTILLQLRRDFDFMLAV